MILILCNNFNLILGATRVVESGEVLQFDKLTQEGNTQQHRQQLENDLQETKKKAYAQGTWSNWFIQWKEFFVFCEMYGIQEMPVSTHTLCFFAQHLAYTFKSSNSVKNYLAGVVKLHSLECATTRFAKF